MGACFMLAGAAALLRPADLGKLLHGRWFGGLTSASAMWFAELRWRTKLAIGKNRDATVRPTHSHERRPAAELPELDRRIPERIRWAF